jgi:signal transduction histidine kinase
MHPTPSWIDVNNSAHGMIDHTPASIDRRAEVRDAGPIEKRQYRFLKLLAASASDLLQSVDLAPALDRIFAVIRTELSLDIFFHYDWAGKIGRLIAHGGLSDADAAHFATLDFGEGVCGSVALKREPLIAADIGQSVEPRFEPAQQLGIEAFFATPLVHGDILLGTLAFGRRSPAHFDKTEIRFLETLCSYVTLARHRISVDRELRARLDERDHMLAERAEIERKMIELTRAGALGSIAATVAHELNQPLAAATNYMAAIRLSPGSDPRIADLTRSAEEQLQRAGEIIRRIRRMVRNNDVVFESGPLAPVIEEAIGLVRAASRRRLPDILVELGESAGNACFDNVQIVQVLANLLRNAAQACDGHEGRTIRISTSVLSPDELAISVADDGPGVPAELRNLLFMPGLGGGRRAAGMGLGLGLAISHNLVEGHGGRMWASETPGGGATFSFSLPR